MLSGDRSWRRGVDFEYQLTQVMRSIADNWRRIDAKAGGFEVRESNLRVAVVDNEDDDPIDPGLQGASSERNVDWRLPDREQASAIVRHFADDPAALEVLEGWRLGLTRQEMMERSGMSRKQLEAAIRRVRRTAKRRRQSRD